MYVVNHISMLIRGNPLFGHQYWSGPASLHISIVTIAQYLLERTRSSRKPWARSRPNATTPAPLEPFKYSPIEEKRHRPPPPYLSKASRWISKMCLVSNAVILCPPLRGSLLPLGRKWTKCRNIRQRPVRHGNAKCMQVLKNRSSFWQPKLVWIDSVCIDQTNEDEKARQIELMEEIYRKAYIVSAALVVNLEALDIKEELRRFMGNWAAEIWLTGLKTPI